MSGSQQVNYDITLALSRLAMQYARLSGQALYEAVSQHIVETLDVELAFVGQLTANADAVQVFGGWTGTHALTPAAYPLSKVLSVNTKDDIIAWYLSGKTVPAGFPQGLWPQGQRIRAYCAVPLFDAEQGMLGYIVAVGAQAFQDRDAVVLLLQLFVGRVSAEIMRYRTERTLRESEHRFRTLFEQTPNIAVQGYDAERRVIFWNRASEALYGYTAAEAIGQQLEDLIIPDPMREAVIAGISDWLQHKATIPAAELSLRHKDGSHVPVFSNHVILRNTQNQPEMYCLDIDLRALKHAEERLRLTASVFTHAHEGIMITDANACIIEVNEAFTRITGYSRDEVMGKSPRILQSGQQNKVFYTAMWRDLENLGYWSGELWNRRRNGELYAEQLTITVLPDSQGQLKHYVGLFSDITTQKEYQRQLEQMVYYDALTKLPNRVLLADRLTQAMAQVRRRRQQLAVVYIDLDGFKAINDHYGHTLGDKLLLVIAERMTSFFREGDTLARIGGDEFVAVLVDFPELQTSKSVLTRLLDLVAQPVVIGAVNLQISASLGVTIYPQVESIDADQLLRQADQAMYQAKLAGGNRYTIFDADQDRSLREHHEILERLNRALIQQEFVLYYQPKVSLRTGVVVGAEALIRWQHPEQGLLPPVAFLPIIDDNPLSIELGEWVIATALSQAAAWQAQGLTIPISVNISARHLQQVDFAQRLQHLLTHHPEIAPQRLELEILETHALKDIVQVSKAIHTCSELGVSVALDDFGTGYASLNYLKRLPVHLLKIDQSFVRDMLDDPHDLSILEGILSLARAFERKVIAEGVETTQHGIMLLQLGCELAQGYSIARPMPAADLPQWITHWRPDPAWETQPLIQRRDLPILYTHVEHRAWLLAVGDYLHNKTSHPPSSMHLSQRLHKWAMDTGQDQPEVQIMLQKISALHERLTILEQELVSLHIQGRYTEAQAKFSALGALCDMVLEQLQRLLVNNDND